MIDTKQRYVSRIKIEEADLKKPKRLPKIHCCYLCGALISGQIRRHLTNVHKNHKLILEAKRLGETEFVNACTRLISLGDYNYNYSDNSKDKEMLVSRRPNHRQIVKPKIDTQTGDIIWPKDILNSDKPCTITSSISKDGKIDLPKILKYDLPEKESGDKYAPCKYCYKTMKRSLLSRHKCIKEEKIPNKKGMVNECDNLIPDIHPLASQRLRDLVLKQMRAGYIKDIVKRDESIILFGNSSVKYYNNDQDYQMIRHQLRVMADIVHFAQSKNNAITKFEDLLHRDNLELVEEAMRTLTDYDEASATVDKTNKTKEITMLLKKVLDFFNSRNSRLRNDDKVNEMEKFWEGLKGEVKILNKKSRECSLKEARKRKPKVVPKISDINKLVAYAEAIRKRAHENLKK